MGIKPVIAKNGGVVMLNRNAEGLFWIGRYMERAENHARLIDVHYHLHAEDELGLSEAGREEEPMVSYGKWMRTVDALGCKEAYELQYGTYREADVLYYMTLDRHNSNSIISCVYQARSNLRSLREKLPSELWETVNSFYLWLQEKQPEDLMRESPHLFYGKVKEWTAIFMGFSQSIMPRENEWRFIECGRYLERAENTLRIMKAVSHAANDDGWCSTAAYPYLHAVLKSVSGSQPFRRYYADVMSVESIIEFVILNTAFPRSVYYSLQALDDHMRQLELQDKQLRTAHDRILRQLVKVNADLACLELENIFSAQLNGSTSIVDHLLKVCQQLGEAFARTFFRMGEETA